MVLWVIMRENPSSFSSLRSQLGAFPMHRRIKTLHRYGARAKPFGQIHTTQGQIDGVHWSRKQFKSMNVIKGLLEG
jgi:hypothetical protein